MPTVGTFHSVVLPKASVATLPTPRGTWPLKESTCKSAIGAPVSTITCGPGSPFTSASTQNTLEAVDAGSRSPGRPIQSGGMTSTASPQPTAEAQMKRSASAVRRPSKIILASHAQAEPTVKPRLGNGKPSGCRPGRVFLPDEFRQRNRREKAEMKRPCHVVGPELDVEELESVVGLVGLRAGRRRNVHGGPLVTGTEADPRIERTWRSAR